MSATEIVVVLGGIALIAVLASYFFALRKATHAQVQAARRSSTAPSRAATHRA